MSVLGVIAIVAQVAAGIYLWVKIFRLEWESVTTPENVPTSNHG